MRLASWLGLAVLCMLIMCFGTDAGVVFDEEYQREYGDRVLAWYRSGFRDDSAMHYLDLYLYGGLFDLCAQWLVGHSPLGPYETRHLLTACVAVLGMVITARMTARVGGPWAGFLAGAMLALTPTWVGHGLFNPKDIPFGVAAIFATSAAVQLALGPALPSWRAVAWAGLGVGIALAVRPGGVFVLAYPCFAAGARALLELQRRSRAQQPLALAPLFGGLCARAVLLLCVAWPVMLSAWPWAQLEPFAHPLQAMRAASRFQWVGDVLFRGEYVDSHKLPFSYLPTWFAITLPGTYLVALACAGIAVAHGPTRRALQGERLLAVGVIGISVLLPLTAVFVVKPVIYDGHRHFLFLFPPLAALAGIALAAVFGALSLPTWLRGATAAALAVAACLVCSDIGKLHPYEYVYFNRLVGGLPGAYGRYETDYWGASLKEGLEWLVKEQLAHETDRLRVSACESNANARLHYYVQRWPGIAERVRVVDDYDRADVYLAGTRENCHKVPGMVLHEVKREGTPLLYVIRTEHPAGSARVRAPWP